MDPSTLSMLMGMFGGQGGQGSQGQGGFGGTGGSSFQNSMGGLQQFLSGWLGNSGKPFQAATDEYQKYNQQARDTLNPFYQAGVGATGNFQNWLQGMSNPSGFINNLMGKYQESPQAQYLQQQAIRSGTNAASASGLTGSSPFAQQLQQNAANISSQDMNQWLQNVLGVNTQYGAGQQGLMTQGAAAGNSIADLLSNLGMVMGQGAYGREAGEQQDKMNEWGGGLRFLTGY